ncbi:hypothetical protein [Nocardia tengchongensis]|uniref:hypothetical protein n=1 Tax=Nocardia tengchongensis TaxID=2055889 RepID=UPI00364AA2BF
MTVFVDVTREGLLPADTDVDRVLADGDAHEVFAVWHTFQYRCDTQRFHDSIPDQPIVADGGEIPLLGTGSRRLLAQDLLRCAEVTPEQAHQAATRLIELLTTWQHTHGPRPQRPGHAPQEGRLTAAALPTPPGPAGEAPTDMPRILIPLAEALDRFHAATQTTGNAYGWYRAQAARDGRVWLGEPGIRVPAQRSGRRWMIDSGDLAGAITAHHDHQQHLARVRADYDNHILHPGESVSMTGGGYYTRGHFHYVWYDCIDYDLLRSTTTGHWRCNTCWESPQLEHNWPECHRCSDWSPCGNDCTLSRISCPTCGHSRNIRS